MIKMNRSPWESHLNAGEISEQHFQLLMDISSIRGKKISRALKEYFVKGKSRTEACRSCNTDPGNFSRKVEEIQMLSNKIINIYPYYISYFEKKI
ncbi:hypothetical protein I5501_23310 [Citrobacter freundii]|nr:hypothetical protein [Citrobacter freundii]